MAATTIEEAGNVRQNSKMGTKIATFHYVFQKMTVSLFVTWMITAMVNIIFGYETTSFSGVQSIPAFAKEFGTEVKPKKWALSAARASYTSSLAFVGKLLGSLV